MQYWFQKSENETISFSLNRKSVATGCNKGLLIRDILESRTKWFPLAKKSVSTRQNEGFVEK